MRRGGGIFADTATLTNSTVSGNSTRGILVRMAAASGPVTATLTNSTVSVQLHGGRQFGGRRHISLAMRR